MVELLLLRSIELNGENITHFEGYRGLAQVCLHHVAFIWQKSFVCVWVVVDAIWKGDAMVMRANNLSHREENSKREGETLIWFR